MSAFAQNLPAVHFFFSFLYPTFSTFSGRLGGCRVLSEITGSGRGSYLFEVAVEARNGRW